MLIRTIRYFILFSFSVLPAVTMQAQMVVKDSARTDAFLVDLFKQYPQYFDSILLNRDKYNVQVIYTKIDRGANGIAGLKNFYFNVDPRHYFYPAGVVALPISLLALQRFNELKATGIDKNSTMLTEAGYGKQTAVYNDPAAPGGRPTLAQYFKRMLVTGDEEACNRLYELSGQQYINEQLQQKGYANAQITERLCKELNEDENRHTNPVVFLSPDNKVLYRQPAQYNDRPVDPAGNRLALEDLHNMLTSLVFPNKVTSSQRFAVTDDDRRFILKYMRQLPSETIYPPYRDDTMYFPAYNKFLLYGASKDTLLPGVRIFNVAGQADGQLTDIAYIVDLDKKIEFFL